MIIQKIEDINPELLDQIKKESMREYRTNYSRIYRHGSADIVMKRGKKPKEKEKTEPQKRGRKPKSESHKKRTKEAYKLKLKNSKEKS